MQPHNFIRYFALSVVLLGSFCQQHARAEQRTPAEKTVEVGTKIEKGEYAFFVSPIPDWVLVTAPLAPTPAVNDEPFSIIDVTHQSDRRSTNPALIRYFFSISLRANNEQALSEVSKISAKFNPRFQTLHIHEISIVRDGKKQNRLVAKDVTLARREEGLEQAILDGEVTALTVLEDLRVGDLLHYSLTINGENPVLNGLSADSFRISSGTSPQKVLTRVLLSESAEPALYFSDGAKARGKLVVTDRAANAGLAAFKEIVFTAFDVPATKYEEFVPQWHQETATMTVGNTYSWAEVSNWATSLFDTEDSDAALEKALEKLGLSATSKLSDQAKIVKTLEFVQDEVRYFGLFLGDNSHRPNPAQLVLERRYGDCKDKSNLLVKLLRKQGFDAWPVLVSTSQWRAVKSNIPNMYAFNHVITAVELDGLRFFIDPTNSSERGSLAQRSQQPYGFGLALRAGETDLTPITQVKVKAEESSARTLVRLSPSSNQKSMTLALKHQYRGVIANTVRARRAQASQSGLAENALKLVSSVYGEATQIGQAIVKDTPDLGMLEVEYAFELKDPWMAMEQGLQAISGEAIGIASFISYPSKLPRRAPIDQVYGGRYIHEFELTLPENRIFVGSKSLTRALSNPGFTYAFSQTGTNSSVKSEHRFDIGERELSGDSLNETIADARKLQEMLAPRIVVKRKDAAQDRSARLRAILEGN